MRPLLFLLAAAATLNCTSLQSNPWYDNSNGYRTIEHTTLNSLNQNGSVTLNDVTVNGLTKVNGTVNAADSTFQALDVNGQVDLNDCMINGKSFINGFLKAKRCHFKKEITASSSNTILKNCTLASVFIKNCNSNQPQVIDLSGSTLKGSLTFESGNGEIIVNSDTDLSKASIKGGVIVN